MASRISLDAQNPIVFSNPTAKNGNSCLSFNFQLPNNSNGLLFKQFLVVAFPKFDGATNLGTANFKFNTASATATLRKGSAETDNISVSVQLSVTDESHIVYVRHDDINNNLTKNVPYRLEVCLTDPNVQKPAAIFWRNVDLYTSSGMGANALILDYLPGAGSVAIFGDYKASTYQIIKLEEVKALDTAGKDLATTLYQYGSLDFRIRLKLYATIRAGDGLLLNFCFPDIVATLPTAISSTEVDSTADLKKKVDGTFTGVNSSAQCLLVSGFKDNWLQKDREFNLVFKGAKAGDGDVTTSKVTLTTFYKNSVAYQSYHERDFITVSKATLTLSVAHYEDWDIYMGGAWPLVFKYTVTSGNDLARADNGQLYVTLQHTRFISGFEVVNFVAPSCDFSNNTADPAAYLATWGGRPPCYVLNPTDNDISSVVPPTLTMTTSSTAVNGSGIFWTVKKLLNNKEYVLNVWVVADVCATQNVADVASGTPASLADPLDNAKAATTKTSFKFDLKVYKNIDQTKRNSDRFTATDEIGTASVSTGISCYSTYRGQSLNTPVSGNTLGFGFEVYEGKETTYGYRRNSAHEIASSGSTTDLLSTNYGGQLFYKEFTDPVIFQAPATFAAFSANTSGIEYNPSGPSIPTNAGYLAQADVTSKGGYGYATSVNFFQPLFLYSDTTAKTAIGNAHAVVLRGDFGITQGQLGADADSRSFLPTPVVRTACAKAANNWVCTGSAGYVQSTGQLQTFWGRNWFIASAKTITDCVMAWNVNTATDQAVSNTILAATKSDSANDGAVAPSFTVSYYNTWVYISVLKNTTAAVPSYTFADYPNDPLSIAGDTTIEKDLRNYFIKNTTMDQAGSALPTTTTPAKVKIFGKAQTQGVTTPGGKHYTINPNAVGYVYKTGEMWTEKRSLKCAIANNTCLGTFYLYTNCLKWAAALPSNKVIYNHFDVIFSWMPSKAATLINNGPNHVIRFVKLFPEAQLMQDVVKRSTPPNTNNPFIFHYAHTVPESQSAFTHMGSTCVVEINREHLSTLGTAASNAIAVFLFNIPLLQVDVSDVAATYPVGSLDTGVSAWGNSNSQVYTAYGQMGCKSVVGTSFPGVEKSLGYGVAGLNWITVSNAVDAFTAFSSTVTIGLPVRGGVSQKRSHYSLLLGSVVLITGITAAASSNPVKNVKVSATAGNQSLIIPTKCPNSAPNTDQVSSQFEKPYAYVVSLKATDWKTFDGVEKVMTSTENVKEGSILFNSDTTKITTYANVTTGMKKGLSGRFLDYFSATANNANIFEASGTAAETAGSSAIVIFLTSEISLETAANGVAFNSATAATASNSMSYYSSNKSFYVYGVKFSQSLVWVNTAVNAAIANVFTDNSATYTQFYGIKRPTALSFWAVSTATGQSNAFKLGARIALFSAGSDGSNRYFTNASVADATTPATFALTFVNSLQNSGGTLTAAIDTGTNYKSDSAGNTKISFGFPALIGAVPKYALLVVSSSNMFTANTICGLSTSNISVDGTKVNSTFTFENPSEASTFVVVCYNVTMVVNPVVETVAFELNGIITAAPAGNYAMTYTPGTPATYTFANDGTTTDPSTLTASLGSVTYWPATEDALGSVQFQVTIPRDPVRDGRIVFEGVFSAFVTTNTPKTKIRCIPAFSNKGFGAEWDKGDVLIDTCDISRIDTINDSISVVFKKMIYKGGLSFDKTLFIDLLPVTMGKLLTTSAYRVLLKAGGGATASANIIKGTSADLNYSSIPALSAKLTTTFQTDTLCKLNYADVFPRLTNWNVDFTFNFDLTTNKAALTKTPNEFFVFFPATQFGDIGSNKENALCIVSNARVPCSFNKPGLLVISYTGAAEKNFAVTVSGVRVGAIDANISFFCGINNVSVAAGVTTRVQLQHGSGLMNPHATAATGMTGVVLKAVQAKTWNLVYYPPTTDSSGTVGSYFVSNKAQRSNTDITIRFGVDFSGSLTSQTSVTLTATPTFHFLFPNEFPLEKNQYKENSSLKPTVECFEYAYDDALKETKNPVSLGDAVLNGQRLTAVAKADITVSATHKFWQCKLSGVYAPDSACDTPPIEIAITNDDHTQHLRTFVNANTAVSEKTLKFVTWPAPTAASKNPKESVYIVNSRGFNFGLTEKWDLNFNDKNSGVVKAGRYTSHTWAVTANPKLAMTSSGTGVISLSDTTFSLANAKGYTINTSTLSVKVMIGTACTTTTGEYIAQFTTTLQNAYGVPAVRLNVNNSDKGVITIGFKDNIAVTIPGGSLKVVYSFSEADSNVDEITLKWTGDKKNSETAKLTAPVLNPNTKKAEGLFSIEDSTVSTAQIFTLEPLTNFCWSVSVTTLTAALTGTPVALTPTVDYAAWFKFIAPATDTLAPVRYDRLRWTFTPTLFPINLYCALVCATAPNPTQSQVVDQSLTAGPLVQLFTAYVSSTTAFDVIFTGLSRGQSFGLTCVFETTQSSVAKRSYTNYTVKSQGTGNATSGFTPVKVDNTVCLQFTFSVQPTTALRKAITGYCQNTFSPGAAKAILSGCIVCQDDLGTVAPGSELTKNTTCPTAASRLRSLSTNSTNTTAPAPAPAPSFDLLLCMVPDVVCKDNVPASRRLRDLTASSGLASLAKTLQTDLGDNTKLEAATGLKGLGLTGVSTVSDTAAPVIVLPPVGASSNSNDGSFSVVVNYNLTSSFQCYYQVSAGTTAPTAASIKSCTSTACGSFILSKTPATVSNKNPTPFVIGTSYTVWAACYNRVPGAQLSSDVLNLYLFTPACPTGQMVSAGACVTPTPTVVPTPSPTGTPSSYLFMSMASIIAMIYLLLS